MRTPGPSKTRFDHIFTKGQRVTGKLATVISEQGTGLLGFATSRKIGSQPRRNLAKRIFREAYNLNRGSDTPLLDLVVVIQPSSQEASFVQIKEELRILMEKTVLRWEKRSGSS